MEILRDRNQLDLELYYAVQLLNARTAGAWMTRPRLPGGIHPRPFVPFPARYNTARRATIQSLSAKCVPEEPPRMLGGTVRFQVKVHIAELSLGAQANDALGKVGWGASASNEAVAFDYKVDSGCQTKVLVRTSAPGLYFVMFAPSEPQRLRLYWIDHATSFTVALPHAASSQYVRGMQLQGSWSTVVRNVNGQ
jgi:hypothetical protein